MRTSWVDKARVAGWLPEGEQGTAKVSRFTLDKHGASLANVQSMFNSHGTRTRPLEEGVEYTRLVIENEGLVMSDTPQEIHEHSTPMFKASGKVLIHGLGIGMITAYLLRKENVDHVTVVEINPDVISLVHPHLIKKFGSERLTVINDSALTWKPKTNSWWDFVWHDIWTNITSDNLPEMHKLHRRFGRRCDVQESWARWHCEQARDQEKRMTGWNW